MRGGSGKVRPKATDISPIQAEDLFREAPDTSYLVLIPHIAGDKTNNKIYFMRFSTTTSQEVDFFVHRTSPARLGVPESFQL